MITNTINQAPTMELHNQSEVDINTFEFSADLSGLMKPQDEQKIVSFTDPRDETKKHNFLVRELTPAEKTVVWETMIPDEEARTAMIDPDADMNEVVSKIMTQEQQIAHTIAAQSKAISLGLIQPQIDESVISNLYEDARVKLYDVVMGTATNVAWQFPEVSENGQG